MDKGFIDRDGFKYRIRKAREKAGYLRDDVVEALGLSKKSIEMYECGRGFPCLDTFITLCRFYRASPQWILTGEDGVYSDDYSADRFIRAERSIRLRRGLSQTALGQLIGVGQRSLSLYERYEVVPSLETAVLIAWALDTSMELMLGGI